MHDARTPNDEYDISPRTGRVLVVGIVLLGTALRLINLDSGLWYDELRSLVISVRAPLLEIVTHFPNNNDHLLLSALSRISIVAFGEHAWSMRLPAAGFGIACLPMVYALGAALGSRLQGALAALMLAVSYHHIWYSQSARGYTALLFGVMLATHLLLRGLATNRRGWFVGYGVVAALGAYAHLTMVLVVVCHAGIVAVYLLARSGWRFDLASWLDPGLGFVLGGVLTLVLYGPVLLQVEATFTADPQPASARVATTTWAFWALLDGLRVGFAQGWIVVAGAALFGVGCWGYLRRSPLACALFVLPGPFTLLVATILQRPTFPRFFFFLAGFGLLILVRGAVVLGQWLSAWRPEVPPLRRASVALPLLFAAAFTLLSVRSLPYGYRYPKQDFAGAARYVEDQRGVADGVVVVGTGTTLPYQEYFEKPWPNVADVAGLDRARDESETVWLLLTFQSYIERREPALFGSIVEHCTMASSFHGTVAGGDVHVYRCGGS